MDREEYLKDKLYSLWKKEAIRIEMLKETSIKLGLATGKKLDTILTEKEISENIDNVWDTIEDFGIPVTELKKLGPTYKEIFEVYSAIKAYRISVRLLRDLKERMGGRSIG